MTGQRRGDDPASHGMSPATGPWQPDTSVIPRTVRPYPHEPSSAARGGRLAAERGRRAGRWLALAMVLVLVPLLMVLVGWVIG